jgi:NADPH:quinone reductase-like Zn-dependent oxidoreductase
MSMAWQVPWLKSNPFALMNANKGVIGVNLGNMWSETDRLTGWLESLRDLWAEGKIRAHIHARVPFDNPAEAHRMLHDRENFGKVILVNE